MYQYPQQQQQQQPANAWKAVDLNGVSLDSNGQNFLIDGITLSLTNDVLPKILSPNVSEVIRRMIWAGPWDGEKYPLNIAWQQIDANANPSSGVNFIQAGVTLDDFSDERVIFSIGKEGVLKHLHLRDDDGNEYTTATKAERDPKNLKNFTTRTIREICKENKITRTPTQAKKMTIEDRRASDTFNEHNRRKRFTSEQKTLARANNRGTKERQRADQSPEERRKERDFNKAYDRGKKSCNDDPHFGMLCISMSEHLFNNSEYLLNPAMLDYTVEPKTITEKRITVFDREEYKGQVGSLGFRYERTDKQIAEDFKLKPWLMEKFKRLVAQQRADKEAQGRGWTGSAASALGGPGAGSFSLNQTGLPFPSMLQYPQMGNNPQPEELAQRGITDSSFGMGSQVLPAVTASMQNLDIGEQNALESSGRLLTGATVVPPPGMSGVSSIVQPVPAAAAAQGELVYDPASGLAIPAPGGTYYYPIDDPQYQQRPAPGGDHYGARRQTFDRAMEGGVSSTLRPGWPASSSGSIPREMPPPRGNNGRSRSRAD